MNSGTIFLRLAGLKIAKQTRDIRGKNFLKKQMELQKIFEKFFIRQGDALVKRLKEREDFVGVQIIEKSEWWDDILAMFEEDAIFRMSLDEILNEIYTMGIDTEFKERNAEIGGSFTIENIFSKNYASERAGELMRGVSETTRNELREIFSESWTSSDSLKEISEKIQNKFTNFASWRADLIAMQETSFAYEVGRADQFAKLSRDTGITGWKRSQSQGDDTVRATHRQNELDGWIPNDELFSGTLTMHAPHGFRCRCVVVRRLLEPQIDEKKQAKMKAFDNNMTSLALRAGVNLTSAKQTKNAYINTLNTLSVLNAQSPGKRDGKPNPLKKEIYELKYEIVENFVKKIKSWEMKGRFFFWFDQKTKISYVSFSIDGKRKSYHIPNKIRNDLQKKYDQ